MKSQAQNVDDYLKEVPVERKVALERLRDLCRDTLTNYDEDMAYGMPTYARNGAAEVAFASQKNYIALYIMKKDVVDTYRSELPDCGKGCIRYRKPEELNFVVITSFAM